jgi:glycosyltransferase 2 family protein
LLVSAVLLVFLMRRFDLSQLQNIFQHADLRLIGAAVLVLAASPATSVARWSAILRQLNHPLPVAMLTRWLYIGAFFSQVLPSTVGGDVWRIWACRRAGVPLATATHSVLLERLAGVLVIVMFLAATSPWLVARMDIDASRIVLWLALAVGLAAVCGVAIATARRRTPVLLPEPFRGLCRAGIAVGRSRYTLWLMLITAIAGQLVAVLAMYLLARSIGAPLSFADCVITLAPALLIAMVPVSLGGWGVRESAFVVILHFYDVSREQALTLSILFGLALMGASLLGLALWIWQPAASRRLPLRVEAKIEHCAERTSRY